MSPADRLPDTASGPESDDVPLDDVPELDRGEIRADNLEFERVTPRVVKRRRPTRLIIPVIILIVAAGGSLAIWGDDWMGPNPAKIPLVKAPDGPFKIKPEIPGGMPITNRDKLVYGLLEMKTPEQRGETLLPQPEQPLPAPKPGPSTTKTSNQIGKSSRSTAVENILPQAQPLIKPTAPASLHLGKLDMPKLAEAPASAFPPAGNKKNKSPPQKSSQSSGIAEASKLQPTTQNSQSTNTPKKNSATKSAFVALLTKSYQVQLAAVRDVSATQTEWRRLQVRHKILLGNLKLSVVRADLGSKGIFYRLRAGPLIDQSSAKKLCKDLIKVKVSCLVVKPSG